MRGWTWRVSRISITGKEELIAGIMAVVFVIVIVAIVIGIKDSNE